MSCTVDGQNEAVETKDNTTPPLDSLFAREISPFNLGADTVASGINAASLVYDFTAAGGHGIVANDEILLLDIASNKSFFAVVLNVAVNLITVDRPIDHVFPVATTLGRLVTTQMNVDGSVTPQIFSLRAGSIPTNTTRFMIRATNDTAMDYSRFAGIASLTRGLVFRIVNSFQKTIFCFKNDGDMASFCFDVNYSDRAPTGEYGLIARFTFAGEEKHDTFLQIKNDDVIQWVVQDDLQSLLSITATAQGKLTK